MCKLGIFISPSGVLSVWLRYDLVSMKQRFIALEKKSAEDGLALTEVQVQALESKKDDDLAYGEIKSHHLEYSDNQDSFMW